MGIWQKALTVGLYATGISLALLQAGAARGGMIISELGTPVLAEVESYRGLGFHPDPVQGQLDSDHWRVTGLSDGNGVFGGTHVTGDFARGTSDGGVTTGGVYAFETEPEVANHAALGFQPIGSDLTPGALTLRLVNATGARIDRVDVRFNSLSLNNGGRSSVIQFAHSLDDATYSVQDGLEFQTPLDSDGTPDWVLEPQLWSGDQLGWAAGGELYLRWAFDDFAGTGSRDEWAVNEILITSFGEPQLRTVPEPESWIALAGVIPWIAWRRRVRSSVRLNASKPEISRQSDHIAVGKASVGNASVGQVPLG